MTEQEHRSKSGFETRAIHAGYEPDAMTGSVIPPIYATSTYKQDGVGGLRGGYEYSRSANPTRTALEGNIAALEEGEKGFAFASGLAAEDTLVRGLLDPGDHVVLPGRRLRRHLPALRPGREALGVEHSPAELSDVDAVAAAIRPGRTKMLWVETPTNPLLGIADIEALAALAHDAGALLVVDNTFARRTSSDRSTLGADVVVHSTTKYAGGHSDVVGGAACARPRAGRDHLGYHQNAIGAVAGPFDSWLVLRGLKTLAVRMDRHCDNAEKVVEFLGSHPAVTQIYYPVSIDHPGHGVAARQMSRFGGMVSFRVAGGELQALAVCERAEVFTLGSRSAASSPSSSIPAG